jgi:hypothetical protein
MEGTKVRKRALLRVLLAGLSVFAMASRVGAVPVVTDCPGGSCDLQELLDGSSITIGDKQFHNFRNFSSTAGGGALQPGLPLSAGSIPVTSQEDLGAFGVDGEIGLLFKFANAVVLSGQNTLTIGWEYDVTVVGGNNAIVDNTLMFPGGGIFQGEMLQSTADTALGASLQVLEVVSNAADELVVRKVIIADEFGATPEIAHRDFAPFSSLHISTALTANGGPQDVGATVQFDYLVESFSQQVVPEPPSLLLTLVGLVALAWKRSGADRSAKLGERSPSFGRRQTMAARTKLSLRDSARLLPFNK